MLTLVVESYSRWGADALQLDRVNGPHWIRVDEAKYCEGDA